MGELTIKYWEGRTPPERYYATIDPYQPGIPGNFDLPAIIKYARAKEKKLADLSQEEVDQFKV